MEPELDPLETFKNDVMQRLSMLSELISTIDDSTTTTVVRFEPLAVNMDAEKLRCLVFHVLQLDYA